MVTTPPRPRIQDLNEIPSPFLTGAIPFERETKASPTDVAILETTRGCPYRWAFCYWGRAIGQKVRAFDRARLRQEGELFARRKVATVVLCDANFGMLPAGLEFVEDLIELREQYATRGRSRRHGRRASRTSFTLSSSA
jgi:radical SAM superfamily enzyme YgiQ (UPF0313 family)